MASWKSGWAKRHKIEIDNTNIDSSLSHFPIPVFIGTSVGQNSEDMSDVFDELTSDANRKKIAVTEDDGTTELYVEIEKWDDANEKAVLWVSNSTWSVSDTAKTTIYLYYDSSQSDNTTYVADVGSRTEVWDSNFELVWHLSESSGSAVDSTSNNNDGTYNSNLPTQTTGKVGDGQHLDGSSDNISIPSGVLTTSDNPSISTWINLDVVTDSDKNFVIDLRNDLRLVIGNNDNNNAYMQFWNDGTWYDSATSYSTSWLLWSLRYDGIDFYHWKDTTQIDTQTDALASDTQTSILGSMTGGGNYVDGILDEFRVSSSFRSDAWQKANYYSQDDNILDWYAEETSGYTLTAGSGSFSTTGQTTNLLAKRLLTAAQGSFTTTGQTTNLLAKRLLTAAQGLFTTTGQTINLLAKRLLTAAQGSFTTTGIDTGLYKAYRLVAEAGSFVTTGISITIKKVWEFLTKHTTSPSNETKHTANYSNEPKHTTSPTFGTKHTTSPSNESKNTTSWNNLDKN